MPKGIIVLMGVLVVGLAVSMSAGQTREDDARALAAQREDDARIRAAQRRAAAKAEARRKAEAIAKDRAALAAKLAGGAKTELGRFVAKSVPQARVVGVGSVLAAKVMPAPLEGGGPRVKFQNMDVTVEKMLYGPRPKGEKVSLSIELPRDRMVEHFRKGDKIICAWGRTPGHSPAAVRWSKQAEKAVLFALAPGWERGKCFRCPWCREKDWTEGKGKCGLCGGATTSGAFKLCAKCAVPAGRCQMCKRTVGPATRGAKIDLSCRSPYLKVQYDAAAAARMGISPGGRVSLWICASIPPKASVAELRCPDGKELGGCETLYFIVDSPGRREAAVLLPILPLRRADAKFQPKPLMNAGGTHRAFWAEMSLNDGKGVFKREGRHTVRAAAGRLVSNPITVVVKEHKPAVPVPRAVPRPRPRPAWLENVVPQITPDGRGVQAVRGGKMMWKMRLRQAVGAIEQRDGLLVVTLKDGKTVVTLDLATGKMISKKVAR